MISRMVRLGLDPFSTHIRASKLVYNANYLAGFYMRGALILNEFVGARKL